MIDKCLRKKTIGNFDIQINYNTDFHRPYCVSLRMNDQDDTLLKNGHFISNPDYFGEELEFSTLPEAMSCYHSYCDFAKQGITNE